METIIHTRIEIKTIAGNGSEQFGATAECLMWTEDSKVKMKVSQHGKTKLEAEQKLIRFLSGNGTNKLRCIEEK